MPTPTTLCRTLAAGTLAVIAAASAAACAADTPTAPATGLHAHAHAPLAAKADARPERPMSGADLAAVRATTARYHRVEVARADGFVDTRHCVAIPGAGMGVHHVNGARIGDGVVDATRPEVLVYEPQADGTARLVAVEYMVPKPMWDAMHPGTRPELFGQAFGDGPMNSYALHVWVWRHNAAGMFADFNPAVTCPAGDQNP
jgi:hypothetical protein